MNAPQLQLATVLADLAATGRKLAENCEKAVALLERAEAQCESPARETAPTPMPIEKPMMMTVAQVARELQVHVRTLTRMVAAGEGPKPIKVRGATRFRRVAVERWIARRES